MLSTFLRHHLPSSWRWVVQRSFVNHAVQRLIPPPTETLATPQDFLKKIGRSMDTKLTIDSWEEFWKTPGYVMKKKGLAIKDRRYTLWCMEKYRQGVPIEEFAHEPRPKKTIRGWGPKIVNGKLNRSKRDKSKK